MKPREKDMKKVFYLSAFFSALAMSATAATTPWWHQPSICRVNNAVCYPTLGIGFDDALWDTGSNCRGMKLVCPDALTAGGRDAVAMGKTALSKGTGIKPDFDTNVLNGDCFGARKTSANGTLASVNGNYVNVWCPGILTNPDENVASGEITYGAQPTCQSLADDGYAAVVNNKCYGKQYSLDKYFIECGRDLLPSRIIVLNGADVTAPATASNPATRSAANAKFSTMMSVSKTQRDKYFKTN